MLNSRTLTRIFFCLSVAATGLLADASLTLVRRDANTVAVVLQSSEPVAGLQLTVSASPSVVIAGVESAVSADWIFGSNLLTSHELRLLVLGRTRSEFPVGSTEIARITISGSEASGQEYSMTLVQLVASNNSGAPIAVTASPLSWNGAFDPTVPVGFTLAGNYPNPFNPSTTISFSLDRPADVQLAVYDMLGREIAVLVNGPLSSGTHQATWSVERGSTSTGTYFARLAVAGRSQVARMVVAQ